MSAVQQLLLGSAGKVVNSTPTLVSVSSALAFGGTSQTVFWPAGHAADDVAILQIIQDDNDTTLTPSGWTHVNGSPTTISGKCKLSLLWKRATSSAESAVGTGDGGAQQEAAMAVFRGCVTTGNPADIANVADTASSNDGYLPSLVANTPNNLLVFAGIVNSGTDGATAPHTGWTGFVGSPTTLYEFATGTYKQGMFSAPQAAPGSIGSKGYYYSAASYQWSVIALLLRANLP